MGNGILSSTAYYTPLTHWLNEVFHHSLISTVLCGFDLVILFFFLPEIERPRARVHPRLHGKEAVHQLLTIPPSAIQYNRQYSP